MADKVIKNYKIAGSGVLGIDGDTLILSVEDRGDFYLARVLTELDGKPVKFSFSYDEDYVVADTETGEILE